MKRFIVILFVCSSLHCLSQLKIYVHQSDSIHQPLSGRLYIFITAEPINDVPSAFYTPVFASDVKNWSKEKTIVIDNKSKDHQSKISALSVGKYYVKAIIDVNKEERGWFNNGNWFSSKQTIIEIKPEGKNKVDVYLNTPVKREFKETEFVKQVELKSKLLSAFHHKSVFIQAGVILPKEYYDHPDNLYPIVYVIPGWGGTHYQAMWDGPTQSFGIGKGLPKIFVFINPQTQTPWGLHAFVDSKVNGPWGRALVTELIPYIKNKFRATSEPQKTFVMGHSSGGYPSLWLPLHYPKAFGGGWAVSPDPVDFTAFTGINLYSNDANFYHYKNGSLVPFDLENGKFISTQKEEIAKQMFVGDGGQHQSFEAEFGVLGKNGKPEEVFNRKTGKVNPQVVKKWKAYDLAIYIQNNWKYLAKYLAGGKLHLYVGENDNYMLDKAVIAFKEKAEKVKADISIDIIPGADHFSIWTNQFSTRIQKEIDNLIERVN